MLTLDQILEGLTVDVTPFAICEARGAGVIDLGSRDCATLHYVLSGSGTFSMLGLPDIQCPGGTIVITPARVPHRLQAKANARCESLTCAPLDADWQIHKAGQGNDGIIVACSEVTIGYRGIEGLFDYLSAPLVCGLENNEALRLSLEQVLKEFAAPRPGSRSLVRALMLQCMIHILRQTSTVSPTQLQWITAAHDARLWRAVKAIFDHPESSHTLETLAETAQMSRSAFAEHFKQAFARGPIDLLKQVRLQLAAHLLISSERSIKSVTRDVGYASRSYFSRAFHDHFGMSPAEYRAVHRHPAP